MADYLNNTIMRTVSFVERIEVEFHGNVISQAMVLEDVDNDLVNISCTNARYILMSFVVLFH